MVADRHVPTPLRTPSCRSRSARTPRRRPVREFQARPFLSSLSIRPSHAPQGAERLNSSTLVERRRAPSAPKNQGCDRLSSLPIPRSRHWVGCARPRNSHIADYEGLRTKCVQLTNVQQILNRRARQSKPKGLAHAEPERSRSGIQDAPHPCRQTIVRLEKLGLLLRVRASRRASHWHPRATARLSALLTERKFAPMALPGVRVTPPLAQRSLPTRSRTRDTMRSRYGLSSTSGEPSHGAHAASLDLSNTAV